ncbi:MAG: heme ABC exporter ATP-binding protein CcmA [Gemmataceae bacterium]
MVTPPAINDDRATVQDARVALCAAAPVALEARGLTLVRGRRPVLRNVDVAVSAGEMVALQGDNGAGKTTLFHCLTGALRPTGGEVRWLGKPAAGYAAHGQIGFLGHESGLYLALTVRENLIFAGRMYGLDRVADRAERLLETMGLHRLQEQQAGCLSRGLKQRLAIARAVMHEPPILLLDEPFTSLDSAGRDFLGSFLCHLRSNGCAILVASHEVDKRMFDRILVLKGGCLHAANQITEPRPPCDAWRS